MKRQIKFRGKRLTSDDWVCGYYVHDVEWAKSYIYLQQLHGVFYRSVPISVIPESVVQCISRKDSTGTEIYESDFFLDTEENDGSYYVIEWDKTKCAFVAAYYSRTMHFNEGGGEYFSNDISLIEKYPIDDIDFTDWTISGNIYDSNPGSGRLKQ